MSDTLTGSATLDNLYAGDYPVIEGAVTVADGQTLVRGSVVGEVLYGAVTADGTGNTGDGTCTALATVVGGVAPVVGDYVATCITAVTHGGIFNLVDPNGGLVAGYLPMTASTGAATVFEVAGLAFTLTDAATDFIVGDAFTISVAAGSGSVELVDKTAIDGTAIPYGVMLEAVTTSGATQASVVAKSGEFTSSSLGFVAGTAYTDVEDLMRDKNMYIKVPVASVTGEIR